MARLNWRWQRTFLSQPIINVPRSATSDPVSYDMRRSVQGGTHGYTCFPQCMRMRFWAVPFTSVVIIDLR